MCIEIKSNKQPIADLDEHLDLTNARDYLSDYILSLSTEEKQIFIDKLSLPCSTSKLDEIAHESQETIKAYINEFNIGFFNESFESTYNFIRFNQR